MYSMVLFMVERSLSGVFRSGHRPMSALLRYSAIATRSTRPVKVTWSSRPSRAHCVFRSSRQSPKPSRVAVTFVRPRLCTSSSMTRSTWSTPSCGPMMPK